MSELLGDEEPLDLYKFFFMFQGKPSWLPKVMGKIMGLMGQKRIAMSLSMIEKLGCYDYNCASGELIEIKQKVIECLSKQNIDAVLSPAFAIPAGKPKYSVDVGDCFVYLSMYNLLNFPAGVVPVTVVGEDEQYFESPCQDMIAENYSKQMNGTQGLPVGVQIASLPMQEEIVCKLLGQIEKGANFHEKYPYKY